MGLRLGDIAPDFVQESTQGTIRFHQWIGDAWAILFSHPKDFTPVCTTELGAAARLKPEFERRNAKILAVSVDPVADHLAWIGDIERTQQCKVDFPILGDADHRVSELYDMLHPGEDDSSTVRSVFFIDPAKKIRAIITYPKSVGRNFAEILRVLDALQLTDRHPVVTPVDWRPGEEVIIAPSLTDPELLERHFPQGWREALPYLRLVSPPEEST
ncbi:MAG: antioxidant protein [Porticoccaceae bacterium]|nr:MAG: antioxidant protein [Porticoccaceae bacterium]